MCCVGCESVARTIVAAGLERYYQHREAPAALTGAPELGGSTAQLAGRDASDADFERLAARRGYLQPAAEPGQIQACLMIDGMRCGACVWLLEKGLGQKKGVSRVQVNYAQQQALVQWDAAQTGLSSILAALRALGYRALPFDPSAREERLQGIERQELRRLFVAGLGMMQVMMIQTPLYWAHADEVDPSEAALLRWASLVLTLPVLLYSAWPLLRAAVRDVVHRHLGMDVPVALGLLAAYLASAVNTWRGAGEVYFDTVTMFVFLLLAARWLEARARRRSQRWLDRLSAAMPQGVRRIEKSSDKAGADALGEGPRPPAQEKASMVLAEDLQVGDLIVLDPGASVPADAFVLDAFLLADCSLLSGESEPQRFVSGTVVPSGAVIAQAHAVRLQVVRPAQASTRADLQRLIARAGSTRPALAELADRAARWFVLGLLGLVVVVLASWLVIDPSRALEVVIAVLVVSCPCALSLAVPSAIAAVQSALAQAGVILQRGDALERLAAISDVVFDKTGTLTQGQPEVRQVDLFPDAAGDEALALRLALPLAQASPHPLALAIARRAQARPEVAGLLPSLKLEDLRGHLGHGVEARVAETPAAQAEALPERRVQGDRLEHRSADWSAPRAAHRLAQTAGALLRLGSLDFACPTLERSSVPSDPSGEAQQEVWLSIDGKAVARWRLDDPLRADAVSTLRALKAMGLRLHMLSGDHRASVDRVVAMCGVETFVEARAAQTPQDKWQAVLALQAKGAKVLMLGDGLNDAAVLAAADMSAAVGQASDLARLHAGALLLSGRLEAVVTMLAAGRHAMRLMRQNIAWATVYNLLAIPAAALGWIPAWGAALGMSASSLLVVMNSLRGLSWKLSSSSSR